MSRQRHILKFGQRKMRSVQIPALDSPYFRGILVEIPLTVINDPRIMWIVIGPIVIKIDFVQVTPVDPHATFSAVTRNRSCRCRAKM